ncbi:hypothetical protein [Nonomuraea composti]|uniref:hypothetical protein n=1 Tax=Nonomuraea composti TaxID=2720023 RepID=UPI001F0DBDD5|nr:hypothetical protein [Nonomuraea sp. FMUSA5-5]
MSDHLQPLLRVVGDALAEEQLRLVLRAYEVAARWHDGRFAATGARTSPIRSPSR